MRRIRCRVLSSNGTERRLLRDSDRKSRVVANLPKYQRHLRLTLVIPADRFRTVAVESGVDDEAPPSAKIGSSRYSEFFNTIRNKRTPQISLFTSEDAIDMARGLSRREQSCC